MLTAQKAGELRFEAVSILDGSRVNLGGLAEVIHAGRMRAGAGVSEVDVAREDKRVRRPDCLADRIQQARERVRLARGPETLA